MITASVGAGVMATVGHLARPSHSQIQSEEGSVQNNNLAFIIYGRSHSTSLSSIEIIANALVLIIILVLSPLIMSCRNFLHIILCRWTDNIQDQAGGVQHPAEVQGEQIYREIHL